MVGGIILGGGKSSRIGKDKAFLKLNGKYLIKHVIEKVSPLTKDILIIAPLKKKYLQVGFPVIPDLIPNLGPLGGIYTGLLKSKHNYNFIVSCDMPFISTSLLRLICKNKKNYDAVIVKTKKGLQPLGALYSKNCLKIIKKQIESKKLKLKDFIKKLKCKIIPKFDNRKLCFYNVNTLKDLRLLQAKDKTSTLKKR